MYEDIAMSMTNQGMGGGMMQPPGQAPQILPQQPIDPMQQFMQPQMPQQQQTPQPLQASQQPVQPNPMQPMMGGIGVGTAMPQMPGAMPGY